MDQNAGTFLVWRAFKCLNPEETHMVKITTLASCAKNNSGIFGDSAQQCC